MVHLSSFLNKETITQIFEKIDLAKLVPPMDTLLDKLQFAAKIAVLAGPLVMLFLGLWYFLAPPKEANHYAGFRTWFGMGSVEAWRMTQKIAGITWGVCGLVLSVVMWLISRGFATMDVMQVATKALICVIWQVVVAFITYVLICFTVTILYTGKGDFRWKKEKKEAEECPEEEVQV